MNTQNEFLNIIDKMAKAETDEENNDYVNEKDGLLYCGICNTPKEKIIEFFGEAKKVYRACTCRQKEIDEERKKREEFERRTKLSILRDAAFEDKIQYRQTFENDDGTLEHRETALKYVENFEKMEKENIGLILTGAVGTGKTYLASAIANALIEKGITVKMTNFATILNDMMNLQIDKNKYIKNLNDKRLLIIDDFGIQRDTSFALEHIFNIVDSRCRAMKPIIITTNLSVSTLMNIKDLKEKRIYERILEMATPIIFTGENHRLKIMKEKANIVQTLLNGSR